MIVSAVSNLQPNNRMPKNQQNNKLKSTVKKIRSIWSFIKRRKAGSTSKPPKPADSPSGTWYSTLDLPLDRFIHCLVSGDLSFLIIGGQSSSNDLYNAWEKIYELFLDAMKDKDGLYKVRLMSRINKLKFNYELIDLCIKYLTIGYKKDMEDILRQRIHLDAPLDPKDRPAYMRLLQTAKNRSQRLQINIETDEAEYAILTKKEPGQPVIITYQHFDSLIAQVSLFMKFRVNKLEVSTAEFASYYSMMREHNDFIRSQNKSRH